MIGKLISGVVKLATLPIDVIEIGADLITGGDGSRRELKDVVPMASNLRDKICEQIEEIDK